MDSFDCLNGSFSLFCFYFNSEPSRNNIHGALTAETPRSRHTIRYTFTFSWITPHPLQIYVLYG